MACIREVLKIRAFDRMQNRVRNLVSPQHELLALQTELLDESITQTNALLAIAQAYLKDKGYIAHCHACNENIFSDKCGGDIKTCTFKKAVN